MHSPRHRTQERDEDDPASSQARAGRADSRVFDLARLTWDMDRQAAAVFPGLPESVATARRFVRITGAAWRLRGAFLDDVELCMSELVGNAVTHTATSRVTCRLWSARGVLFLEVDDEGRKEVPQVEAPGAEDEHGRGLLLIESFAAAWGTAPRLGHDGTPQPEDPAEGKTVWAALLLPG